MYISKAYNLGKAVNNDIVPLSLLQGILSGKISYCDINESQTKTNSK